MRLYTLLKEMITSIKALATALNTIGVVYESNGTKSCPTATSNVACSCTLQPGTYVMIGNAQWPVSSSALTIADIYNRTRTTGLAITRGTMNAGGGDTVARIVTLDEVTVVEFGLYQATGATRVGTYRFAVLRIK